MNKTEWNLIQKDFVYFAENYVKVQHPTKGTIPLLLKGKQFDLANKFQHSPNHLMALTARQVGGTTISAAYLVWYSLLNSDKNIVIAAEKMTMSREIIWRVNFIMDNLPDWLKLKTTIRNKTEVAFENSTRISALSFYNFECSSRGRTISLLYTDQLGFAKQETIEYMHHLMSMLQARWLITTVPTDNVYPLWSYAQTSNLFNTTKITYADVCDDDYDLGWLKQGLSKQKFEQDYECTFHPKTVGYKGKQKYDGGYYYAPYIPLMETEAAASKVVEATTKTTVGVSNTVETIQTSLSDILNSYCYEINDAYTRQCISNDISNYLSKYKTNRDIYDYEVCCDETNNPPSVVDLGRVNVSASIQPTRSADKIYFNLTTRSTDTYEDKLVSVLAENIRDEIDQEILDSLLNSSTQHNLFNE